MLQIVRNSTSATEDKLRKETTHVCVNTYSTANSGVTEDIMSPCKVRFGLSESDFVNQVLQKVRTRCQIQYSISLNKPQKAFTSSTVLGHSYQCLKYKYAKDYSQALSGPTQQPK
ncbi:hypothetical protein TNCV_1721301 [Trichonephila clavipes]|nr:hypothetical protein TNCV_1721301 [Trichonephila clavipes]